MDISAILALNIAKICLGFATKKRSATDIYLRTLIFNVWCGQSTKA